MCCYCVVVRISLCMSVLVFVCVFACVHELLSVLCVAAATFFGADILACGARALSLTRLYTTCSQYWKVQCECVQN